MPHPRRRSSSFATSDVGQWWFELLREFGLTPTEWGQLDQTERRYLEAASIEHRDRADDQMPDI